MKAPKPAGKAAAGLAKKLEKLGIRSRLDLVLHLPMRYEDETALTPADEAPLDTPVLVEGEVLRAEVAGNRDETVEVVIDPMRMESYGLDAVQIIGAQNFGCPFSVADNKFM